MQGMYRGKGLKSDIWMFGYFVKNKSNGNCYIYVPSNQGASPVLVDSATVGQRLHKIGDLKLYYGDLLRIAIKSQWTGKIIAEAVEMLQVKDCKIGVEWGHRREFTALTGFTDTTSITLVGNRWDNPELLGER